MVRPYRKGSAEQKPTELLESVNDCESFLLSNVPLGLCGRELAGLDRYNPFFAVLYLREYCSHSNFGCIGVNDERQLEIRICANDLRRQGPLQ